jgi:hypothetical protein
MMIKIIRVAKGYVLYEGRSNCSGTTLSKFFFTKHTDDFSDHNTKGNSFFFIESEEGRCQNQQ